MKRVVSVIFAVVHALMLTIALFSLSAHATTTITEDGVQSAEKVALPPGSCALSGLQLDPTLSLEFLGNQLSEAGKPRLLVAY